MDDEGGKFDEELYGDNETEESMAKSIQDKISKQLFFKARNYIGNNVLVKKGNITMEHAKANLEFSKWMQKEGGKQKKFRHIDEYLQTILPNDRNLFQTEKNKTISNLNRPSPTSFIDEESENDEYVATTVEI